MVVVLKLGKSYEKEFVHEPTGSKIKVMGSGSNKKVYVTGMHTPVEHRGKGGAHEVLKKLTAHLDSHEQHATLVAKPQDDATDKKKLEGLYRKHGFRKDGPDMTRTPKTLREFLEESHLLSQHPHHSLNRIREKRKNREED